MALAPRREVAIANVGVVFGVRQRARLQFAIRVEIDEFLAGHGIEELIDQPAIFLRRIPVCVHCVRHPRCCRFAVIVMTMKVAVVLGKLSGWGVRRSKRLRGDADFEEPARVLYHQRSVTQRRRPPAAVARA